MTAQDTAGLVAELLEWAERIAPPHVNDAGRERILAASDALTAKDSELAEMRRTIDHNDRTIVEEFERVLSLQRELAEARVALEVCQRALAMMISPDAIGQTSVANAFAAATEAEARARAVLSREKEASSNE